MTFSKGKVSYDYYGVLTLMNKDFLLEKQTWSTKIKVLNYTIFYKGFFVIQSLLLYKLFRMFQFIFAHNYFVNKYLILR